VTPLVPVPGPGGLPPRLGEQPPEPARQHARATRGGELVPSREFPRVGIAGPPGTQIEVAHTPGFTHAVLTIVGGSNMAAAGIQSADLREHIRHCEQLLSRMEPGA
jgi:hypothetical protein